MNNEELNINNNFPSEAEQLLDYLKKKNKEPVTPDTVNRWPAPQDWQRWQIEEQQQYEQQTAVIVQWNNLSPDEQVQAKLSGSDLYRQYTMISREDVRKYWESNIDVPLIKKYLDLIDSEPTNE